MSFHEDHEIIARMARVAGEASLQALKDRIVLESFVDCHGHRVVIADDCKITMIRGSVGCTCIDGNDLFDLGFTVEEIDKYGVDIRLACGAAIVFYPKAEYDANEAAGQIALNKFKLSQKHG